MEVYMNYEMGPIRPPSESGSLLVRVTRGCHWNKCYFCGLYKDIKFSILPIDEIKSNIEKAAKVYKNRQFSSCFLQDSDAFVLRTDILLEIVKTIKEFFPNIKYITSYARADSILRKTLPEMIELKNAGLNHLYSGMETGSDTILRKINKGITAQQNIDAGLLAKQAGMILSEFTLLGIGGKEYSEENALETAKALNIIAPDFIRVHATAFKMGTKMEDVINKGDLTLQSEEEIVLEQRLFIEALDNINCTYINEHIVNLIMEVRGSLQIDKTDMLEIIKKYLDLSQADKLNFAIGRRLNYYFLLEYIGDIYKKAKVEEHIREMRDSSNDVNFTRICNYYRSQTI